MEKEREKEEVKAEKQRQKEMRQVVSKRQSRVWCHQIGRAGY